MTNDEKMKQVPFGSSAFQIMNFTANQDSPERSYRNILLQLDAKQKAMKECYFRRMRREIDIAEIEQKMKKAKGFAFERLQVDKEEAEFYLESEVKLIEDCIIEIKLYEELLKDFPEFTREQFEKSEANYWKVRFLKQAQLEIKSTGTISFGVLESLEKIGCHISRNDEGKFVLIENNASNTITEN